MTDLVMRLEDRVASLQRDGLDDRSVEVSLMREAANEICFLRVQLRVSQTGAALRPPGRRYQAAV
jgi:hypothetical protein